MAPEEDTGPRRNPGEDVGRVVWHVAEGPRFRGCPERFLARECVRTLRDMLRRRLFRPKDADLFEKIVHCAVAVCVEYRQRPPINLDESEVQKAAWWLVAGVLYPYHAHAEWQAKLARLGAPTSEPEVQIPPALAAVLVDPYKHCRSEPRRLDPPPRYRRRRRRG